MMIGGAPAARSLDACDSNAAAGCSHGSMPPLLEGPPAVGLVGAGDRPSDADILAWENQILWVLGWGRDQIPWVLGWGTG